jgi:hypothetical protein
MTPVRILYFVLRGLTLCLGVLLGLLLLSAFVWVPFYAAEGYTVQFQDRIRGLIGQILFFVAIIIPFRWTVTAPYFHFRIAFNIIAAAWLLNVDTMAYNAGLTWQRFPPSSWSAIVVAIILCVTLYIRRRGHEQFDRNKTAVPNKSLDASGGGVFRIMTGPAKGE